MTTLHKPHNCGVFFNHTQRTRRLQPKGKSSKNRLSTTKPGTLIAIGGALRLDGPVLPEFYRRSGGPNGRIIILPTASQLPDSGYEYAAALARLGLRNPAQVLPIRTHADACRPEFCQAMRQATGLFLTGGDQARLIDALCGTPFYEAILAMYQRGGTVAGTSAGTAALSGLMIVSGESGTLPYQDIARLTTGLGLIQSCVFDQHFRQRNRIGRLIYAVACHPDLLGIGVDEDTAAVIEGDLLTVVGSGAVTLVDGTDSSTPIPVGRSRNELVEVSGVELHILTQGGMFNLHRRVLEGF